MSNLFTELSLVFVASGILAMFLYRFKFPSLIAYMAAGAILGPFGLAIIKQDAIFTELSHLGVALLLFLVGLELNVEEIKKYGKNAILAGILQIIITAALGLLASILLGFSIITSIYIALALTFSSTILVIKILSEKKELQSLSGRLVVGIFLTQDLIALLILIILSSTQNHTQGLLTVGASLLKGVAFVFATWWLGQNLLEKLLQKFGKSDEMLLILSLAWGLGLATLAASSLFGFSLEIGGFLAGLSLARSSVHHQIGAKIKSLRDFFLVLFFVTLGGQLVWGEAVHSLMPAIWLGVFVLIGNPIIVLLILGKLGYQPRTAFLSAITVGQVSEFSLILASLGRRLGSIDEHTFSLLALISIATITASSYLITHAEGIFNFLSPVILKIPIWHGGSEVKIRTKHLSGHIVIVGAHQMGSRLADILHKRKTKFVIVDFDPEVVEKFRRLGIEALCGDADDPSIQDLSSMAKAKLVVSTLPQLQDNLLLSESLKTLPKRPKLVVTAHTDLDASELYKGGFDYVILPHELSSMHLAHIISSPAPAAKLKMLHHKNILKVA